MFSGFKGIDGRKIIVAGTIFLDIKGYPEGEYIEAGRNAGTIKYVHGGVGRNIAEDLAGLGAEPLFLSLCDADAFGGDIIRRLDSAGVDTRYIMNEKDSTGTWMAIFDSQGNVCASLSKRQEMKPLLKLLSEKGDEIFEGADGILTEMDMDEPVMQRIFELAEKHGAPVYGVISNMTIARERMEYIRRTSCFICNRQEAGILYGITVSDDLDRALEQIKEQMLKNGPECMIVTLDKDGAMYLDLKGKCGICPGLKMEIVDSSGAGDAFFAGASAAVICGADLETASSCGNVVAAAVLKTTENVYQPC